MANTIPLQSQFVRMIRDLEREELPPGAVWNLVDYLPHIDAALTGRGGWVYGSENISTVASGATYLNSVAYAPFATGAKLCAMTDNSKFVTVDTTTDAPTLVSTSGVQSRQRPFFHSEQLIFPSSDGVAVPKSYNGSAMANLGGSPPAGRYGGVWLDYSVLGNTAAEPTRVYFSGAADPGSWDTVQGWKSMLSPVTGIASLPSSLLIFQETSTARIRGSLPPPDSDFDVVDPLFQYGCSDARSIAVQGPYAIFCNPLGVFRTNGTNLPEDLTFDSGLSRYWRSLFGSYDRDTWIISGGMLDNKYFVSITNGTTFVDAFCFDPRSKAGYRISNLANTMYAPAVQIGEELYAADRTSPFIRKMAHILTADINTDANNVPVAPILETPFYLDKRTGDKRWLNLYPTYDMRGDATMTVSVIKNPTDSYSALTTLTATENYQYGPRIPLNFLAPGIGLKFQQVGESDVTRFHSLAVDARSREASRT